MSVEIIAVIKKVNGKLKLITPKTKWEKECVRIAKKEVDYV